MFDYGITWLILGTSDSGPEGAIGPENDHEFRVRYYGYLVVNKLGKRTNKKIVDLINFRQFVHFFEWCEFSNTFFFIRPLKGYKNQYKHSNAMLKHPYR